MSERGQALSLRKKSNLPEDWTAIEALPIGELQRDSQGRLEIDEWPSPANVTHVLWREDEGITLHITPRAHDLRHEDREIKIDPDKLKDAKDHLYVVAAKHVGHTAAVYAMGLPEAARSELTQ